MLLIALALLLLLPCLSRTRDVPAPAPVSHPVRAQSAPFIPARKPQAGWTHQSLRFARKPDWVIRELMLLKAWTPKLGCRRIAETFNRRHVDNGVSVSKSYVQRLLITHGDALAKLRRQLNRQRTPDIEPRNQQWAMDLTEVRGKDLVPHVLLGLIDHGTRACLALHELTDKRSRTIWRQLVALFRRFGIPKQLRVDNEASFNSRWIKGMLWLLGVRLITTNPHSPWQNGRIERLNRTFKEDFRKVCAGDLAARLSEWRWMYNFARPHMAIGYRTPAEAWDGTGKATGEPIRIHLWRGALRAYYFPDWWQLILPQHMQKIRTPPSVHGFGRPTPRLTAPTWRNPHRTHSHRTHHQEPDRRNSPPLSCWKLLGGGDANKKAAPGGRERLWDAGTLQLWVTGTLQPPWGQGGALGSRG